MDGQAATPKFLKDFSKPRSGDSIPCVVDISSCSLHSVHGCMETGEVASNWGLKKIMKSVYTIFHDSPAHRENYVSVL